VKTEESSALAIVPQQAVDHAILKQAATIRVLKHDVRKHAALKHAALKRKTLGLSISTCELSTRGGPVQPLSGQPFSMPVVKGSRSKFAWGCNLSVMFIRCVLAFGCGYA